MAARRRDDSVVVGVMQTLVVLILHFLEKEVEFSSFHCVFGFLKRNNLGNYVRPDIGTKNCNNENVKKDIRE